MVIRFFFFLWYVLYELCWVVLILIYVLFCFRDKLFLFVVVEKSGYEDYVYVGYVEYFGDKGEVVDIGNG